VLIPGSEPGHCVALLLSTSLAGRRRWCWAATTPRGARECHDTYSALVFVSAQQIARTRYSSCTHVQFHVAFSRGHDVRNNSNLSGNSNFEWNYLNTILTSTCQILGFSENILKYSGGPSNNLGCNLRILSNYLKFSGLSKYGIAPSRNKTFS
jgi:hypothetical protein